MDINGASDDGYDWTKQMEGVNNVTGENDGNKDIDIDNDVDKLGDTFDLEQYGQIPKVDHISIKFVQTGDNGEASHQSQAKSDETTGALQLDDETMI